MTDAGWTKGSPADAGFYWFRANAKDASPRIVKVQKIGMGMMQLWRIGSDRPVIIGDGGEFLGPISPDTYHQGRVAGLREAAIICRERGKPHDIEWWNTVSKKEISRQTAIDCAELIEQQAQGGEE